MIIQDDGIRLSAVLEKAEGSGNLPLVIQLHGFSSNKDRPHNIQAAAAMREAGFATLRFDLYGHGESDGEFRKHTLYKWISNTLAVMDAVREMGYTDLYLSGHSQGGLVAALVAGMEPERIRGLILRAPAFLIPAAARAGNLLGNAFDPRCIPDHISIFPGLDLDGNWVRVARTIHVEEAVENYDGPVLILHGDKDDTVPLEDSRKMSKRYADCELAVLTGETHHFDRHPDRMQQVIRNWLSSRVSLAGK